MKLDLKKVGLCQASFMDVTVRVIDEFHRLCDLIFTMYIS